MGFTIVTTMSPEFELAKRVMLPTWHANSGADDIIVYSLNGTSWVDNIGMRAEIFRKDLLGRLPKREKVLLLDADCLVLKELSRGFSDSHIFSVARWPNVNMGVLFVNLAIPFKWDAWINDTADMIQTEALRSDRSPTHECDQVVWRPRLLAMPDKINKLAEWEWNYNEFDMERWEAELPLLRDIVRVLHFKGHGDWEYAKLTEKIEFAKELWPKELACIASV